MHVRTSESEIREVFDRFGKIEEIIMVKDSKTRGFRGYCFIYFKHERDATAALNTCNGMELKERTIRVDYSLSSRPHSPTPGSYRGSRGRRDRSPMMRRGGFDRRDDRGGGDRREVERNHRRRSPSMERHSYRSENRRRSPIRQRSRSREHRGYKHRA
jgi:transformer-2 protein